MYRFPSCQHRPRWTATLITLVALAFIPAAQADPEIIVTYPNGGEIFEAGTTQTITWDATEVGDVNFEIYILNNDEVVEYLGTVYWGEWQIEWPICQYIGDSTNYTIRIVCNECDPVLEDVSDAPFEITGSSPVPTLTLTSPLGGEVWQAGTTHAVTWDCTDAAGYVEAWLFDSTEHYAFIGHVPMADGAITWDIDPFIGDGTEYAVRLRWLDVCGPEIEEFSPDTFEITGSATLPTLTLTSPNGGETWLADSVQTITWNSIDPSGFVEIWLSDSDTRYEYIGSAPTADGQFEWPILPCTDDHDELSVVLHWASHDRIVEDASDTPFAISGSAIPEIVITSPAVGETLTAGTVETITWTSTAALGYVELELVDGARIGRAALADGSFDWDICPSVGDTVYAQIRVRNPECGVSALSEFFVITGSVSPTLTLTSPVGGETWAAGSPHEITWESTNLCGYLDIYLPNDGQHQTGLISVPISAGVFTWPIAPLLEPGTEGQVTIISRDCRPTYTDTSGTIEITERITPLGDIDGDNDIDLRDFVRLQTGFTGRGPTPLDPISDSFDFEPDSDVDIDDLTVFIEALTGP